MFQISYVNLATYRCTGSIIKQKFSSQSTNIQMQSIINSAYKNIIVVKKQTPYKQYLELKAQGKAPVALRWERLKNRHEAHMKCVEAVESLLQKFNVPFVSVSRDELHRGLLQDKDLVIAVGGDGTILNTSSFMDDSIPLVGVNSDPTRPEEVGVNKVKDERRSRGALCCCSTTSVDEILPKILLGSIQPGIRSRSNCLVRSTYTETRLPPSLNDILISHPIPAAVSRFRFALCRGNVNSSNTAYESSNEIFSFNVWSSGLWVSTATGSTAAMHAAGGSIMDIRSTDLQYMIREHLVEDGSTHHPSNGFIKFSEMLYLRWNSQFGAVFVDGSHMQHNLELGDEIKIDGNAPILRLFD